MLLMVGESLLVIIQGENSQRILLMSNHRQWTLPMLATCKNQTSIYIIIKTIVPDIFYRALASYFIKKFLRSCMHYLGKIYCFYLITIVFGTYISIYII